MASRNFNATGMPQSIRTVLGLVNGTDYVGQNVSASATLFLRDAAVRPQPNARAFRHETSGFFYFSPDGITDLWAWTDDLAGCAVIVSEA